MKKYYLLKMDGEIVAVICHEGDYNDAFYVKVRKALSEDLIIEPEDISLDITEQIELQLKFDAEYTDEGENCIRECQLEQIAVY